MPLIAIDPEKCNRDGICAAECPNRLIVLKNKDATPEPIDQADELCINCGHCVAVCPKGALTHKNMSPADCPPIKKELMPGSDHVAHLLRARRSIRTYLEEPVDPDIINCLIDTARYAPSGHNSQPVKWCVIQDRKTVTGVAGHVIDWMRHLLRENPEMVAPMHLDRIVTAWENGVGRVCRKAPCVVITYALKDFPASQAACTIALTYLDLAAPSFGLGTCWAGYVNAAAGMWAPLQQTLDLPEDHANFGAMMIGYPKYRYHRLPLRNDPVVTWR